MSMTYIKTGRQEMKKNANLSKIMRDAWSLARDGATKFGGNARIYFSSALSIVWKEEKSLAIMTDANPATVYHKGLGNRFLLPGMAIPVFGTRKGQYMLPGICE